MVRREVERFVVAGLNLGVFFFFGFVVEGNDVVESDFYRLETYPTPEDLKLEASGLAVLPDGKLGIAIRKGEVWILDQPEIDDPSLDNLEFTQFASGLHEPLGLAWNNGALYTTQRSEVTRLEDRDGDGVADVYLTAAKGWGVSGNYHEYAYGPVFDLAGNMWVTLNITIGDAAKIDGHRATDFPWRGWSMMMEPGGELKPISCGLRSPMGIGVNAAGDVFATDQQGNYRATNPLIHLRRGVFHGHADSLPDTKRSDSPLKHPGDVPQGLTVVDASSSIDGYVLPAVWFPYNKIGQSTTGIVLDDTGGKFGPFDGQFFVGEFTHSFVSRVFIEKVGGEYQGACFHFRKGFQSAVLQMAFLPNGSMVVGESNRGWNSLGTRSFGLERLSWTGAVPFEAQKMEALPQGFRLTFTKPVDADSAGRSESYVMSSYTYIYQSRYGGEEVETENVTIESVEISDDMFSAVLTCKNLREGYVHELHLAGVRSGEGERLLHSEAFYTLNRIPQ